MPAPCRRSPAPRPGAFSGGPRRGSSRHRSCRCPRCPTGARRTSRSSATTLMPPMAPSLPGARLSTLRIGSPASSVLRTCSGDRLRRACASARASPGRRRGRRPRRRSRAPGRDRAGRASRPVRAVISADSRAAAMPSLSVVHTRAVAAQERRAGAFLAAEAQRAVEQAVDEPLEADRHLVEPAAEPRGDAVDHGAADHASCRRRRRCASAAGCGTDSRSATAR